MKGPPVVQGSDDGPPHGSPDRPTSGGASFLFVAALSMVAAIIGVIGGYLLLADREGGSTAADTTSTTGAAPAAMTRPTTTSISTSTSTTSTTVRPTTRTTESSRPATLFADEANVRVRPSLAARALHKVVDRKGAPLTVIGEIQDGWYRVDIEGVEGWMFGAFVLPPDEGYQVALSWDEAPVQLYDGNRNRWGSVNSSGNKVLITEVRSDWYAVLLPEGVKAWVWAGDVQVMS